MKSKKLTRKQLYELVWSLPLRAISKRYEISEHELRRLCITMSVPLPRSGYWRALKNNMIVSKARLSYTYNGKETVTLKQRAGWQPHPAPEAQPWSALKAEMESDPRINITVPGWLAKPDVLIVEAKESMVRKNNFLQSGLMVTAKGKLEISVANANTNRAFRLMDTLIKALRVRGHAPVVENETTYFMVKGHKVKISLREKTNRISTKDGKGFDFNPTGKFILKLDRKFSVKEFMDGYNKLEQQLLDILASLEYGVDHLTTGEAALKKELDEKEELERRRKSFEQLGREELINFKELLLRSERWNKAVNLRKYIEAVEQKGLPVNVDGNLKSWAEWARQKADWYDPFIESEDELLKEVDRETLTIKQ